MTDILSTAVENGGPAFPQLTVQSCERDGHGDLIEPFTSAAGGMTLRDWFAGHALRALLEVCQADQISGSYAEHCARLAYETADAMLAGRRLLGGKRKRRLFDAADALAPATGPAEGR